jgi:D-3-phosphoglycerate dehydrogenase
MNTPFGNSITTAEHAVALMFALARELPAADLSTQAGKWEKNRFMGVELTSKTLGLIGCGNIGSIVADRAVGLRMRVVAYDPFLSEERAGERGVEKVSLDQLLARADFITLHTPLTEQTRNVLSRENLAKTKRGVRIVNCARGGLIDEAALGDALESGHVAGAALDVFVEEPAKANPLFGTPGLIATPHLGASTTEAQVNVAIQVAEQMSDLLTTGGVTNALNVPSLSADEAPRLRPYMALAEMLGSLVGQLAHGGLTRISIETEGHAAALNQKPIVAAVLAGFMRVYSDSVNMVNAPFLARERGIEVREVRHDREGDYHTLVRVSVDTEAGKRSVAGTLFGEAQPRLVELFGIAVEAELTGAVTNALNMPSVSAEDAPRLRPYMALAEKLGSLVGQLAHGGLGQIDIEVEGAAAELNQKPITGAVLAGLMRVFSDTVNMVNAPFLARERGLDVREVRHDREGDYHTLVRVSVATSEGERSVAGTLFGEANPRLVELFGIKVEADLTGPMLYVVNEDAPGFIGRIGTALGNAGVNIGTFHLGRRAAGGEAVLLLSVDTPVEEPLLKTLRKLPGVKKVKALRFG